MPYTPWMEWDILISKSSTSPWAYWNRRKVQHREVINDKHVCFTRLCSLNSTIFKTAVTNHKNFCSVVPPMRCAATPLGGSFINIRCLDFSSMRPRRRSDFPILAGSTMATLISLLATSWHSILYAFVLRVCKCTNNWSLVGELVVKPSNWLLPSSSVQLQWSEVHLSRDRYVRDTSTCVNI